MSTWEFNLPINLTQLDWTSVLGIFTRSIANMTSGKGGGGIIGFILETKKISMLKITTDFAI
jgi:hypothetical protein